MKLFELKYDKGPFGDECSTYKVIFQRKTTVRELIDYVLNHLKQEWGYIDIGKWPQRLFRLEYRWGEIISDDIPEHIKDSIISEADGYGGWTRMDYEITL